METKTQYKCLVIKTGQDSQPLSEETRELRDLNDGEILVQVKHSSMNYKDALAATGHPGVALSSPLVPGIDACGEVVESKSDLFEAGAEVVIAREEFGTKSDGGWSQFAIVPAEWAFELPNGMDSFSSMAYGTAGFTAAQSVNALRHNSIEPANGPIVVTGATGGVGIASVILLKKLGYEVVAVSGKKDQYDALRKLGASDIVGRDEMIDNSPRPMLKGRFAGAIDSVGGDMLETVIRSTQRGGCVTACGLVGGAEFTTSVYPFILRGITLCGIDSAGVDREKRIRIWNSLANEYSMPSLMELANEVSLGQLSEAVQTILQGQIVGRTVVKISG